MDMSNKRLLSLFSVIDDLEYVSTCLSAEKALSAVADVIGIVKYRRSNLWTAGKISLNSSLLSMTSHIVCIEVTSYIWWGFLDNFMKKWQLCVQFRHI